VGVEAEIIDNSIVLTYVLQHAAPLYGRTKLQKCMFLTELALEKHRLTASHFRFYRYSYGPFSRDVWDSYDWLSERGFTTRPHLGLTERGSFLLSLIEELKKEPENQTIFEIVDSALKECRLRTGLDLLNYAYGLKVQPPNWDHAEEIARIPIGVDLIIPKSRNLKIPADLEWLISEELKLTAVQIQRGREQWSKRERSAVERLLKAIADSRELA